MKKILCINHLKKLIVLALVLRGLLGGNASAQETNYKAYTLFIYNFMKYIEWPEAQSKGDFIIGVLGDSPINKELQTLVASKKLKGRNIILKKCNTPEEAAGCHLIYVSDSKSSAVKTLKEQTKDKPILIVGEREGLAKKGASLSFVTLEDDELKFDINKKEIEQHQLKIASSLVNLGIVIN
ncbi:MAG: YfiR family protein [Bacteroidia bacterium]